MLLRFECYWDLSVISDVGKYAKKVWEGLLVFCFVFLLGVRQCNIQSIQNRALPIGSSLKKSLNAVLWHLFCYQNYFITFAFRKVFFPAFHNEKGSWEHFHHIRFLASLRWLWITCLMPYVIVTNSVLSFLGEPPALWIPFLGLIAIVVSWFKDFK